MDKIKAIKILGLIAAFSGSVAAFLMGNYAEAAGIFGAAFSSVTGLTQAKP